MRKKVKIKRNDAIVLYNLFANAKGNFSEQFAYCIQENLELMSSFYDEMVILEQSIVPTERYKKFMCEKEELARECSQLNEEGQILMQEDGTPLFKSYESMEKFKDNFRSLVAEYQDDVIEYDTSVNRLSEIKSEKIEMVIFQVPIEFIPNIDLENRNLLTKYICSDSKDIIEQRLFGNVVK